MNKHIFGLAARYSVASELCLRNLNAAIVITSRKKFISLKTDTNELHIFVHGKKIPYWPSVRDNLKENDYLVLVDFAEKEEREKPDYYILSHKDWNNLIEKAIMRGEIKRKRDGTFGYPGYSGLSVKITEITKCKGKWRKIIDKL
jgi:hypothetical protein